MSYITQPPETDSDIAASENVLSQSKDYFQLKNNKEPGVFSDKGGLLQSIVGDVNTPRKSSNGAKLDNITDNTQPLCISHVRTDAQLFEGINSAHAVDELSCHQVPVEKDISVYVNNGLSKLLKTTDSRNDIVNWDSKIATVNDLDYDESKEHHQNDAEKQRVQDNQILSLQEHATTTQISKLNCLKTYKPNLKTVTLNASHLTWYISKENSNTTLYSCSFCNQDNILMNSVVKHAKKECWKPTESVPLLLEQPIDLPEIGIQDTEININLGFNRNDVKNPQNNNKLSDLLSFSRKVEGSQPKSIAVKLKTLPGPNLSIAAEKSGGGNALTDKNVFKMTNPNTMKTLMEQHNYSLKSLELKGKTFKCKHCKNCFKTLTRLSKHQRACDKDDQKKFLCLICGSSYSSRKTLQKHVDKHDLDPAVCDVCNVTFRNKMMLKTHSMIHTGEHPYKCKVCDEGFIFSSSLKKHLREVHQQLEKDYKCNQCRNSFCSQAILDKHSFSEHSGKKSFLCSICGKSFTRLSSFSGHMTTHRPKKHCCDLCVYKTYSKDLLKVHLMRHKNERNFVCETCGAAFYNVNEMRRHIFNHHTDEMPEKCSICNRAFKFPNRLKRHMILVHKIIPEGRKILHCTICDKPFLENHRLKDHMNIHSGERPYGCNQCDARFRCQKTLTGHKKTHTKEKEVNSLPCGICSKSFKTPRTLSLHQQSVHVQGMHGNSSESCDVCDKSYPNLWVLNRHRLKAHSVTGSIGDPILVQEQFTCKTCGDVIKGTRSDFAEHKESHRIKEREIMCDICEETFPSWVTMTSHVEEMHSMIDYADRLYKCDQCDKTYRTQVCLYQHKRRIHKSLPSNAVQCNVCMKMYASYVSLWHHKKLMHSSKDKLYTCGSCDKSFKSRAGLSVHKQTHLEINERKTFDCVRCHKKLKSSWALTTHLRSHEGMKPFECDICGRQFTQSGDRNKHRKNVHGSIFSE